MLVWLEPTSMLACMESTLMLVWLEPTLMLAWLEPTLMPELAQGIIIAQSQLSIAKFLGPFNIDA